MNKAPYQSIRLIARASLMSCPSETPICDLCIYHGFCSSLAKAFTEARKLSERDSTIQAIIDEEYKGGGKNNG